MYADLSLAQLETLRDQLRTAWTNSLTKPQVAAGTGRRVEYQRTPAELKAELEAVIAEIARRTGAAVARGPIYMAGGR